MGIWKKQDHDKKKDIIQYKPQPPMFFKKYLLTDFSFIG